MKQRELAALAGVSNQCVSDIECGKYSRAMSETLDRIMQVLDDLRPNSVALERKLAYVRWKWAEARERVKAEKALVDTKKDA